MEKRTISTGILGSLLEMPCLSKAAEWKESIDT